MAGMIDLDVSVRTGTGKGAARSARREGLVPCVVYGGGKEPQPLNVKFNTLTKALKQGRFLSRLINLKIDGVDQHVICRGVQRDVVKDLPTHVDFFRLSDTSRINLFIPVEFVNQGASPGLKRGGVLTVVRQEVELKVRADTIPDHLTADLGGLDIGDTVKISNIELPKGATLTITDRDFMVANISAPSSLRSAEDEEADADADAAEGEDEDEDGEA